MLAPWTTTIAVGPPRICGRSMTAHTTTRVTTTAVVSTR
jgi:hypothetical protein